MTYRRPAIMTKYKYWCSYIGMQHQKEPDKTRACIKLMMSPQAPEISMDFLRMSHQLGVSQANKVFLTLIKDEFIVADLINCIVAGDLVQLEINDGFERFKLIINKILSIPNNKLQDLGLHVGNSMTNFLKIAEHL